MARILLAEDEAAVREFVTRALASRGHDVCAVRDGESALAALETGSFDLLLSDVVMPGMDGFELSQAATARRPGMPILLMTGYSAEREQANDLHGVDTQVITKPFTLQALCSRIEDILPVATGMREAGRAPSGAA